MSYRTIDDPNELDAPQLHVPTVMDQRRYLATGNVCGTCKHFSAREGQRLIEGTKFLETLVREHKWQVRHLGAPPADLGDCGQARSGHAGEDTMLTSKMAVACDQYKAR